MPNTLGIVGTISRQPSRASSYPSRCARDADLLHYLFDLCRLMGLAWCQTGIERQTVAITEEVDFGTEASHRSSQGVVVWFICPIKPILRRARSHTVRTNDRTIQ